MNKSDFLSMIGTTSQLNRQMVGEVNELVNIFPYFQSAHLLLLKGLHNIADIKFENQLRKSAIHIADREVLYYLLNTPHAIDNIQAEDLKVGTSGNISDHNPANTVQEAPIPDEVLITERTEVVHTSVTSEESAEAGLRPDITPDENVKDEEPVIIQSEDIKNSDSLPDTDDLLELDQEENEAGFTEEVIEPQSRAKESSGWQLQSALIDKFIITNPRIEPNRDKSALPTEEVNKHIQEEGVFVTETLARIYVNQGYYSKAIDIYEKLSLKFPEKSSYFASQIEKVKEHLKN
jgi:tetratricopeptide (TPR) repeat protein